MANKAQTARTAAQRNRDDQFIGMVLRQWSEMDGDAGEAGKRLRNAIRVMAAVAGDESWADAETDLNNAAEWLRLASMNMDRAANWPTNGR